MTDSDMIRLYFARDEQAIAETEVAYGKYLRRIAYNILSDEYESGECVSDTYMRAWNAIPPEVPRFLSAFLARITRNLSLDRVRARSAERRGGGELAISLSELDECIADTAVEDESAEAAGRRISDFLYTLNKETRQVFVRRYFYNDSISDIAHRFGMSDSKVKSMLHRTRIGLKAYLEGNGVNI